MRKENEEHVIKLAIKYRKSFRKRKLNNEWSRTMNADKLLVDLETLVDIEKLEK